MYCIATTKSKYQNYITYAPTIYKFEKKSKSPYISFFWFKVGKRLIVFRVDYWKKQKLYETLIKGLYFRSTKFWWIRQSFMIPNSIMTTIPSYNMLSPSLSKDPTKKKLSREKDTYANIRTLKVVLISKIQIKQTDLKLLSHCKPFKIDVADSIIILILIKGLA